MKKRVTRKFVIENYKVLKVGYCALQGLLRYYAPRYYTAGVYGWNADVYVFGDVAICTGYRPFGEKAGLVEGTESGAGAILKNPELDWKEQSDALDALLENFLDYNRKHVLCDEEG